MRNEPMLFDDIEMANPFKNARVYISGNLSRSKGEIEFKLANVGATTKMGLAKTTCVIIEGTGQTKEDKVKIQTLAHDGFYIPTISEKEMWDILEGKQKNISFPTPVKNVDITYDFIFNAIVPKIIHFNFYEYTHPLGMKELFMHDINGKKDLLLQSLGNIGAYSNFEFDPKTIDYCWLKKETIEKLKKGEKDEFIQIITNKYNSSSSDKFTYKFIIESEAIFWMEYRAREIGDKISLDYITRYQQSIYDDLKIE